MKTASFLAVFFAHFFVEIAQFYVKKTTRCSHKYAIFVAESLDFKFGF